MRNLVHLCLTCISMTLAILIFLISHEKIWLDFLNNYGLSKLCNIEILRNNCSNLKSLFTYFLYTIILIFLIICTHLSIKHLIYRLDTIEFHKNQIDSFERADDFYLPIYLGYAFVSISLPTIKSFILFFLLMILILYRTRFFYFNPFFLILGYKFYFINNSDKSRFLIITKKEVKLIEEFFEIENDETTEKVALIKINNHTYLLK